MNYFIFDGESSLDYGVYIGGQNTFNAPQRDVAKVAIPGRNGDLVQDNGRFLNVQVPYNIVVMDSFRDKTDAIKAWLLSKKGYCKLVDTYHPGTYRMAMVAGGIDFETAAYNSTGRTQVIFDCKPERFLDSGDDIFQVGVWGQTESASGGVVSFEGEEDEAFRSIAASISPTQDLHSYEYPWPPGGGKNKVPKGENRTYPEITYTVQDNGEVVVTGTATGTSFWGVQFTIPAGTYILNGCPQGGGGSTYLLDVRDAVGGAGITGIIADVGSGSTFTLTEELTAYLNIRIASGYSAPSGGLKLSPMIRLSSVTDPTFAPYSNICPITGRTEATVWRMGKNMCEFSNTTNQNRGNYSYQKEEAADIEVIKERGGGSFLARFVMHMKEGHEYTFSMREMTNNGEAVRANVYVYSDKLWGELVVNLSLPASTKNAKYTATTTGDVVIGVYDSNASIGTAIVLKKFMVCLSTAPNPTTYEPYLGTSYPVSWQSEAGTVYGGSVDVVSGVLTVEWATTDLGLYPWNYSESAGAFYCGISTMKYYSSQTPIISALCSAYPNVGKPYLELGDKQLTTNMYGFSNSQKYCIIKDSAYTDAAEFKAAMSGIQLVYALATPQTYQLSEEEIEVLIGTNNVWADSGDVNVKWSINPHILRNPTRFTSRPKIRVKGSGNGTLTIENGAIVINNLNEYVDIDSELMNCYKGTANKNADVELPNHEYPTLHSGSNRIDFSGNITAVEVQGRWWTI